LGPQRPHGIVEQFLNRIAARMILISSAGLTALKLNGNVRNNRYQTGRRSVAFTVPQSALSRADEVIE
jgi:hypothetical protein